MNALERWLIASLLIAVLVGARVLLRHYWRPHFRDKDCLSCHRRKDHASG